MTVAASVRGHRGENGSVQAKTESLWNMERVDPLLSKHSSSLWIWLSTRVKELSRGSRRVIGWMSQGKHFGLACCWQVEN